ncbi:hypothetical protein AVEN_48543-1, partial [Araneus ventricosus]
IREDVIFYELFIAYLKRFPLSDSDQCSCGGTVTALHYVTECALTVSWHMRRPSPNFEQEWLKRVANNPVSRRKIHRIVKFISENTDLFRPPSHQFPCELNRQVPNDKPSPPRKKKKTSSKENTNTK